MWLLAVGSSVVLCALPWLPPRRQRVVPAEVHLEMCSGCTRCSEDCPFSAVTMVPRTDGRAFALQAQVDPALCSGCGMCLGACPASQPFRKASVLVTGIDRPDLPLTELRHRVLEALKGAPRILVFGCSHGVDPAGVASADVAWIALPCIGMLPPSFVDFVLSRGEVQGVLLTGCRRNDCFHRWGDHWTEARLAGLREPHPLARVPRERVRTFWGAESDGAALRAALADFRREQELASRGRGGG